MEFPFRAYMRSSYYSVYRLLCEKLHSNHSQTTDMYDKRAEHGRDFSIESIIHLQCEKKTNFTCNFLIFDILVIFQNITKRNENYFYFGIDRTPIIRLFFCYCCLRMRVFFLHCSICHICQNQMQVNIVILAGSTYKLDS